MDARSTHIVAALSGVAHDKLVPLIHAVATLAKLPDATGDDSSEPTPAQRAQLRVLLEMARATLTGGKIDQSFEGMKFNFAGATGSLDKFDMLIGGDAPQAMLSAQMGLTLDGLKVDVLPPPFAVYVPTHIAIRPTISNLDLSVLTKMGLDATAPVPDGQSQEIVPPDPAPLFGNGGINFGFDALEIDAAGAKLSGTGKFNMPSPSSITGQAEITATGLDALITRLQADPMMASGVPVAIFLKGIARTTGSQSIWQVTVNNEKVLVNGVDLSAMAGALNR